MRRKISLLLALCLCVGALSGCMSARERFFGETSEPTKKPTEQTEPTTEPTEPSLPNVSATEDALPAEPAAQVQDAYTFTGTNRECHIPEVYLNGAPAESINKTIYLDLVDYIRQEETSVSYLWAVNHDILSICVCVEFLFGRFTKHSCAFYVYNVSISGGYFVPDSALLEQSGLTEEQYLAQVFQTLEAKFREWNADYLGSPKADQWLEQTVSYTNLHETKPFYNTDGELCFVGGVYFMVGPEVDAVWYSQALKLSGGDVQVTEPSTQENRTDVLTCEDVMSFVEAYVEENYGMTISATDFEVKDGEHAGDLFYSFTYEELFLHVMVTERDGNVIQIVGTVLPFKLAEIISPEDAIPTALAFAAVPVLVCEEDSDLEQIVQCFVDTAAPMEESETTMEGAWSGDGWEYSGMMNGTTVIIGAQRQGVGDN